MIEISGVSKTFPARGKDAPVLALKDVDLRIEDGEFLTILGPSGCGKTTLLRMIAGLVEWDKGEITVNGTPPGHLEVTVVPHTAEHTQLLDGSLGKSVHLETDVLAKHVRRLLNFQSSSPR